MIDFEQEENLLKISYFKNKGIEFKYLSIPRDEMFNWNITNDVKKADKLVKHWDGRLVEKKWSKKLSEYRIYEIILKYLGKESEIWNLEIPEIWFCDIETTMQYAGKPNPELAQETITIITFTNGKNVYCFSLKELNKNEIENLEKEINDYFKKYNLDIKIHFLNFPNEEILLHKFLKVSKKFPILTGWNFEGFDWPYIINRSKNLGNNIENIDNFVGKYYLPKHRIVVDLLDIYRKWDRSVEIKENNTLDFVSSEITKLPKLKYEGNLQQLYETNFYKYVKYNIIDTLLTFFINKETNLINVFLLLGNISFSKHRNAFFPTMLTTTALISEYIDKNLCIVKEEKKEKSKSYEGAYVKNPIPGNYNWNVVLDFTSLYPSIMREWNMSPENIITNLNNVNNNEFVKTINNIGFYNKEISCLTNFITKNFLKRAKLKEDLKILEFEISYIKNLLK